MEKIEIDRKIIENDVVIVYSDNSIRKIPFPKKPKKVSVDALYDGKINSGHKFKDK